MEKRVEFEKWLNELIKKTGVGLGQRIDESFNLYSYLKQTESLDGDVIEAGVYNGGSAQILQKHKRQDKKLFLFDTWDGLKDCCELDGRVIKNGMMNPPNNYEIVCGLYDKFSDVEIVKGFFPDSAVDVLSDKISFIHLDVDTYNSTLNGLKFIYDKMVVGGVIVIHDYINNPHAPGVHLAVNEFLEDKKENVIIPKMTKTQGIIIKL